MLLLAGLMGLMAVAATALIGYEIARDPKKDKKTLEPISADGDSAENADVRQDELPDRTEEHDSGALPGDARPAQDAEKLADDHDDELHDDEDHDDEVHDDEDHCDDAAAVSAGHDNLDDMLFDGWDDDLTSAPVDQIDDSPAAVSDQAGDTAALDHWLNQEHQAQVNGFSPDDDNLMIVYDDLVDPDPELSLEPDETDLSRQHIVLNGQRIAVVDNAADLGVHDLTLIAQSTLRRIKAA